jgi:predicted TIM-barrel fold metal-dependent hydrolase
LLTDIDIIDGHVHCYERHRTDQLLSDIRYTGARQFNALVTGRGRWDPHGRQLDNAFELKRLYPEQAFVFGGLDFRGIGGGGTGPAVPLDQQLQELIDVGCDGLKLLIGKPDQRKWLGAALDSDVFEPFLALAEETRFPVLWHVGDPPEFWSEHTVPRWARQRGWWYDATHPKKDQIDAEIASVFRRHPRLNLILPHFFFLSDRLDAAVLEAHPTYTLDLAPGVEMLHNFTANRDAARAFFIRFADRILGTDFGMTCGWHRDRGTMIRRFLETDEPFDVPDDPAMAPDDRPPLRGIALPRDVLAKIYAANFRRVVGPAPRPLRATARTAWMRPGDVAAAASSR